MQYNRQAIAIGVIALLIIVFGWYTWRGAGAPGSAATSTPATSTEEQPAKPAATGGTTAGAVKKPTVYKSLITYGGSHRCDYEQVTTSRRTSGVVYVADGKMRAELRTRSTSLDARSIVVYDGRYLYSWTEGKSTGTKTQPSSISQLPLILPADLSSKTVLGTADNNVSWTCYDWVKDAKLLAPPTYVTFTAR